MVNLTRVRLARRPFAAFATLAAALLGFPALSSAATISGQVTDGASNGISEVCVNAFDATLTGGNPPVGQSGTTDALGQYSLTVPSGTYKVEFRHCPLAGSREWVTEWWINKVNFHSADTVDVTGGNATNVDAQLAAGNTISGRITTEGNAAIQSACAMVFPAGGGPGVPVATGFTDANGDYTTDPVVPGQYKVQFRHCTQPAVYVGEWWDNKPDFGSADPIDLTGGDVTGKNAALTEGRTISGRVTSNGTTGIQNVCAMVFPAGEPGPSPMPVANGFTDANGEYTTEPVLPGQYKVQFRHCTPNAVYVGEWWDDKADYTSANAIDLTSANATGKDAILTEGRTISGKVTRDGVNGIQSVCAMVLAAGGQPFDPPAGMGFTDQNGDYRTEPVLPGTYKLQFRDCNQPASYIGEWWNNQPDFGSATPIDLTSASATGKDAILTEGRTISGKVTSDGVNGIPSVCATVFSADGEPFAPHVANGFTNQDGDYTTEPVLPGSYKVQFRHCTQNPVYIGEWWDDKPDFDSANAIDLTSASATGKNAVLTEGSTISGRVTSDGVNGIQGICAMVFAATDADPFGPPLAQGFTDESGNYTTEPLLPGNYKLQFRDCNQPATFLGEWWDDKPDFESADPIDLTGGNATGKDAQLAAGRTISGTVTSDGTNGIEGVCLDIVRADEEEFVGGGSTDENGDYTSEPLPPGQYKVSFNDCNEDPQYVGEWWNNEGTFDTADPVDLTSASATGIDAVLAPGNTVSGRVTSDGVNGIPNVCVGVVQAEEEIWVGGGADTDENGDYRTDPVPPGNYKLAFSDCSENPQYISEWWNDKPDFDSADPIDLTSGDATGKDAVLTLGHKISGTVTSEAASAKVAGGIEGICVNVVRASDQQWVGEGFTNPDGDYTTSPLPDGQFKLLFEDCSDSPTYISEWYDDKSDFEAADPIAVAGADVTGKNAQLAPGNTVSGRVTSNGTNGIPDVCVDLVEADDEGAFVGGGGTDEDGNYTTQPVPPGSYKLHFGECSDTAFYVSEWWNDKPSFDQANPIDLTGGSATGKDAQLLAGGGISGRVRAGTDGTGPPLADICVGAEGTDVNGGNGAQTGPDGTYRIGSLPPGHYTVFFTDCREDQSAGSYHPQQVQNVTVVALDDTENVNANMGSPDNTEPDTFITAGVSGSTDETTVTFTFGSNEADVSFQCRLDTGDWNEECGESATFPDLSNGPHTVEARAVDAVGHIDQSPAVRNFTVDTSTPVNETTAGTLPPSGGTVSDDPAEEGPTAADPVTAAVSAPADGDVSITDAPPSASPPSGYSFFGVQVQITSTVVTTVTNPLRIVFTVDGSALLGVTDISTITAFRDGQPAGNCTGPSAAAPDPCVLSREALAGGDVRITILSSHASTWNVGRSLPSPSSGGDTGGGAGVDGGGGGPTPVGDTTPPVVRLTVAKAALKLRTVLRKGLVVTVSCNEPCSSSAKLALAKKVTKRLKLPAVVAKAGGQTRLVLKLGRKAKRAFAKLRKVTLTLQVTTADAAGNQTRTSKRITLKR